MKVYTHSKYSYVRVAEIPKSELRKIDFALCKQPTETLSSFYNRQTDKPAIIANGGFFAMSTGATTFNYVTEGETMSYNNSYQWGMGIMGDNGLQYGWLKDKEWRDFIGGYPILLDNKRKCAYDYASGINYKARRTAIGYNDDTIFLVCVENPGMLFPELQDLMLDVGCKYAINLDGGGSTKMLHNGVSVTQDATNRPVDNVVAVYLKPTATNNPTTENKDIKKIKLGTTEIIQSYFTENECYKVAQKMTPTGIVVHSTGVNNPNLWRYCDNETEFGKNQYNNHWNQFRPDGRQVCVHAFIGKDKYGKIKVCNTLPYDICCWGVGGGSKGSYNFNPAYIQFEICEDNLTDRNYFAEVFDVAAEYCAYLCKTFNISIDNVISHNEAHIRGYGSNHSDCDHWLRKFGRTMDDFRNDVKKKMGISTTTKTIYRVGTAWTNGKCVGQVGAYSVLANAQKICDNKGKKYYVFDENGKVVYPIIKNIDITYQTYCRGAWQDKITNYNAVGYNGYSGIEGAPIQALKVSLSKGSVQYRAHTTDGKWWDWVTDSIGNSYNSYAGVIGKDIDAIQVKLIGDIAKTHEVKYRVSSLGNSQYFDWVVGANGTGYDSYAGIMGTPIDKVQMIVEAK